jgi:hypothetical protein
MPCISPAIFHFAFSLLIEPDSHIYAIARQLPLARFTFLMDIIYSEPTQPRAVFTTQPRCYDALVASPVTSSLLAAKLRASAYYGRALKKSSRCAATAHHSQSIAALRGRDYLTF